MRTARSTVLFLLVFAVSGMLPGEARSQHYGAYHKLVNEAEGHLAAGRTDSALKLYDAAFRRYDFVFARDAACAAQIALHTGRDGQVDGFLLKGASSGLSPECVESIPMLRDYLRRPAKSRLRQRMADSCARFSGTRDTLLAAEWRGRYEKEQQAKKSRPGDWEAFAVYRDIVRENVEAIAGLWKSRHLFPGDRIIGLGPDCGELASMWAFYSLAHFDCCVSSLREQLWAAVEAGMLHPRQFAALWEFERLRSKVPRDQRTNEGCRPVIAKFNIAWFSDTDAASRAEVRENRSKYWICAPETDSALRVLERTEGYKLRFGYR